VRLLQQQLAQLNYDNGPTTGIENADTVHAIQYLQRDETANGMVGTVNGLAHWRRVS
jgi:peptidoglycan hydrolase-like protein with peptidoglycan-binding domain